MKVILTEFYASLLDSVFSRWPSWDQRPHGDMLGLCPSSRELLVFAPFISCWGFQRAHSILKRDDLVLRTIRKNHRSGGTWLPCAWKPSADKGQIRRERFSPKLPHVTMDLKPSTWRPEPAEIGLSHSVAGTRIFVTCYFNEGP